MKTRTLAALGAAVMLAALTSGASLAAGESAVSGGAARAAQQAANPNTNLGYLFAIYIITWAGFFAYIFFVSRRQRDLEREIKQLRQTLEQRSRTT